MARQPRLLPLLRAAQFRQRFFEVFDVYRGDGLQPIPFRRQALQQGDDAPLTQNERGRIFYPCHPPSVFFQLSNEHFQIIIGFRQPWLVVKSKQLRREGPRGV